MDTIASRVAHVRKLSGLSAAELGRRAGLSRATVAAVEGDAEREPETKTLTALARCTGAGFEWLATGDGDPPSEETVKAAVALAAGGGKAA